jgi:hypothetical protein
LHIRNLLNLFLWTSSKSISNLLVKHLNGRISWNQSEKQIFLQNANNWKKTSLVVQLWTMNFGKSDISYPLYFPLPLDFEFGGIIIEWFRLEVFVEWLCLLPNRAISNFLWSGSHIAIIKQETRTMDVLQL